MAAPPSTPDPTGYPYLCHTDFALPPGQKVDGSIIAISAGTKGKITGYSKASNGQEWCSITTPYETPQRIGWVPLGYLHVGSRKYGDLELEIESQVIMKMPAVAPLKSESQLTKAIRYYFLSCKENASKIKFCPPWFLDVVRNEKRRDNMVAKIINAMPPKVRGVLDQPKFNVQDLIGALDNFYDIRDKDRPETSGVYTMIYSDFKKDRGGLARQPEQYVGKTVNFRDRANLHSSNKNTNKKSKHYQAARDSHEVVMGALCEFPREDVRARAAAEQVFTNLLETHLENVFNVNAGDDVEDDEKLDSSKTDKADKLVKYLHDKECAIKMTAVAEESFKASGWPQACRRASYGCSRGLNWNTPITELMEFAQTIYVRTQVPSARMNIYRRPPLKVRLDRQLFLLKEPMAKIQSPPGCAETFQVPVGRDGPPAGTWVYPVFELTTDGTAHAVPWSRLPSIGPFSDWAEALSLALKIEWRRADGQLVRKYIQVTNPMRMRPVASNMPLQGVPFRIYAMAVAVVRFLKQQNLSARVPRPPWQPDFGIARLKDQTLSWLDQRMVILDVTPDGSKVLSGTVGINEMHQSFMAAGLNCPDPYDTQTAWYGLAPVPVEYQVTRLRTNGAAEPGSACDSCYLLSIKSRELTVDGLIYQELRENVIACVQHRNSKQCTSCFSLGRPCSWTLSVTNCPLTDPKVLILRPRPLHAEAISSHVAIDPQVMEPDVQDLTQAQMEAEVYNAD